MAVTINGTTGIAGVDGSASTPAVQGTDTNTGIFFPAADTIAFGEGGAESARLNADAQFVSAAGTASLPVLTTTGDLNTGVFYPAADTVAWTTGGSERARITSGGYFKASNNGSYVSSSGTYHELCQSDDTASTIIRATNTTYSYTGGAVRISIARNTTNGSFNALVYYNEGAAASKFIVADSGNVTNTNGTYGTISDAKLKQDIVDAGSQWDDIKNLRFRKYRLKNEVELDPNAKPFLGLIAQEAELVCPGLIEESRDTEEVETTDADGNVVRERRDLGTTTKSIKTSILYMKAVKALQEAQLRIETLEAQNAAFEARLAALEAK